MQILRRRVLSPLLLLGLVTAASVGCSDSDDDEPDGSLAMDSAMRASSGIADRRRVVIRDQDAWEEIWQQLASGSGMGLSAPAIDFDEKVAIVATRGTSPNSGYEISITGVARSGNDAEITVYEVDPGARCVVLPVLVTPVDVYVTPRFSGEAIFIEKTTVNNLCR